jgi:hypothetical protein
MKTLAEFAEDARTLELDAFSEQYGEAFLVLEDADLTLKPPEKAWQRTIMARQPRDQGRRVFSNLQVYSVRHTGRSASPKFVTVGRAEQYNDISIIDESVSAFHAFFERGDSGEFLIQDYRSKNGTFVNDQALKEGVSEKLVSGDVIRFGAVAMMFLLAQQFVSFARMA